MREYFCGWYFKCQSDTQTLAVIPAFHRFKAEKSCSVKIITDAGAWNVTLPYADFQKQRSDFHMRLADNRFGSDGMQLHLHTPDCTAVGAVRFGPFSPIAYDIMGPFRYVPCMECRHSVVSMRHTVNGELCINGVHYRFRDAVGYIEGDRGYSFPREYAWTQCSFTGGSLMLSVADIPIGRLHFTGVICVIAWQGTEYRLATYLGAKAVKIENGELVIRQGELVFTARLIEKYAHPLLAPVGGSMHRTIHESAACRAAYCLQKNGHTLFAFESPKASFEYEYAH